MRIARRSLLQGLATLPLAAPLLAQAAPARVTVLGGGFGGAAVARTLRRLAPEVAVTLIDRAPQIHSCPFSNGVLGGLWGEDRITFGYDGLAGAGIAVVQAEATALDPATRAVTLADGTVIDADFTVLSPGIALNYSAIEGYSEDAAQVMPHAWTAGAQTSLLRGQLQAMPDGGTVVIAVPRPPFRCPPGPYERASLIAHYLQSAKPASKILILDAQDGFSKQGLFEEAWAALYPGMIERIPGAESGEVLSVDPASMRVSTAFDDVTAAVANIIPPQTAGAIAVAAGLDQGLGWCPVDGVTLESAVAPGVHVIGDAAISGDMPKSGFSAHQQGMACAAAIAARIAGADPVAHKLLNTCYSLAAPGYGFSVADVYEQRPEGIASIGTAPNTTALGADAATHSAEAAFAESWFDTITSELWG
jgi:sulfide dehydrogenase [flavocytochrome c] flavoprotein subunit